MNETASRVPGAAAAVGAEGVLLRSDENGVATLTLNRPRQFNAISMAMLDAMEAAVVARPDPKWGETPCAFVVLKADAKPVSPGDIIAWCRGHLAGFKVPKTVVFGELPKTSTGKIQKFELRERARDL